MDDGIRRGFGFEALSGCGGGGGFGVIPGGIEDELGMRHFENKIAGEGACLLLEEVKKKKKKRFEIR